MCGAVQFQIDGPVRDVWDCHCYRCRQFTGHHMAATRAQRNDVAFANDSGLRWYSPEPTVEYGFCSECGSSLFWRTTGQPDDMSISAGCLDQPTGLRTTVAWWMSEHGDYHASHPDVVLHQHDGNE